MAANAKKSKTTKGARRRTTTARRSTRTQRARKAASSLGTTAVKMLTGAADAVRSLVPQLDLTDKPATELLEGQHREVERSFATALDTDDARTRRAAMSSIIEQLTLHTTIEETIFYPAVRKALDSEKSNDMILEAYEEHHVVKTMLKELPKVDPKADTFKAKMTVLKELVEHHVQEEEKEMFPMAERKLGAERSRELAEAMAAHAREK